MRRLTHSTGLAGDPSYSPDGSLIAYDSTEPGKQGIWVMSAVDGSDPRQVAALPANATSDFAPRFAPDGQRLVFARVISDTVSALWIVNLDGSGLRRITPATIETDKPAWSHDGSSIVFNAYAGGSEFSDIWVVGPDGQGLQNLTQTPTEPPARDGYSAPVWSPDDSLILTTHGVHHTDRMTVGLATMRRDGTDLRWVTDGAGSRSTPTGCQLPVEPSVTRRQGASRPSATTHRSR